MNYNCGIYIITNTANGKRYVGSSKRIDRRLSHHKWSLRSNRHHSVALQRAWNKYGEESFSFGVAAYVSESDRIWYEQTFLDSLETYLPANGYNLCKKADANLLHSFITQQLSTRFPDDPIPTLQDCEALCAAMVLS